MLYMIIYVYDFLKFGIRGHCLFIYEFVIWLWEIATEKFLEIQQGDRGGCVEKPWSGIIRKRFDFDFNDFFFIWHSGPLVVYL